jgi:hypothetical protein
VRHPPRGVRSFSFCLPFLFLGRNLVCGEGKRKFEECYWVEEDLSIVRKGGSSTTAPAHGHLLIIF